MIHVRSIREEDFEYIHKWWDDKEFPHMDGAKLPAGYIAYYGDKPIVCGWLYASPGIDIAWVAWITMNPEAKALEKSDCFTALDVKFEREAKKLGVGGLITPTNNASLLKRFSDNDWLICDLDVVHLFKKLGD